MSADPAPPALGLRLAWEALPARLQRAVEAGVSGRVVGAETQPGGFSPGVAAVLQLADGRRVFCKAACGVPNPQTPEIHRRELGVLRALPGVAGVPRLLWGLDEGGPEGDADGWVVLVSEAVGGKMPALPWTAADLRRVVAALAELWDTLTPSPLAPGQVPEASDLVRTAVCGWQRLLASTRRAGLDPWAARHLASLADLEARAPAAVAGTTLLHLDVRADNLLLTPEQVWLVDWPHACRGAAWFDLVLFLPSVGMGGGPDPEEVLGLLPARLWPSQDQLLAAVATLAGYLTERALQPPPPGLPTVRAFQAAQGEVARAWLRRLTGWA